jgi:hypothetical protein
MEPSMVLPTAEAPASPRVAKRFRVRYRRDNGLVCFESVHDAEGYELLLVRRDGVMHSTMITGMCGPCMHAAERDRPACGLGDQCPREKSKARNSAIPVAAAVTPEPEPSAPPTTVKATYASSTIRGHCGRSGLSLNLPLEQMYARLLEEAYEAAERLKRAHGDGLDVVPPGDESADTAETARRDLDHQGDCRRSRRAHRTDC